MAGFDESTVVLLVGIAVAAGLALIVLGVRRAGRRRLEVLGPAFELGTARVAGTLSTSVEGLFQGYSCRYSVEQRSQYSPGGASLRVAASSPLQWIVAKQDMGSRLMTQIGLLKDVPVGDDELDRRLRFAGTDADNLVSVFGQERTRNALRSLSDTENFASVTVRTHRVDVKWSPSNPGLDDDPDGLRSRLVAAVNLLVACGVPPAMG